MPDDIARAIQQHEEDLHPLRFDKGVIVAMVEEHQKLVELGPDITMMVDDLYGKKRPLPGDPYHRDGGRLAVLENGGVKVKIPVWLTAVISGSFLLLATIAGALITTLVG